MRKAPLPVLVVLLLTATLPIGHAQQTTSADTFAHFTGTWTRHGFGLTIEPNGSARAMWRTYQWCGPDVPEPCDSMQGKLIVSGGLATFTFGRVESSILIG